MYLDAVKTLDALLNVLNEAAEFKAKTLVAALQAGTLADEAATFTVFALLDTAPSRGAETA